MSAPYRRRRAPWKPAKPQLTAARGRTVPDLLAPGLKVLFVGINPGLYSGAVGHHFARPGNRFWRALHAAGFTPRLYSPHEERKLLSLGLGITNFVERATAAADELPPNEIREGARRLERKVNRRRPAWVAFLGLEAYRTVFDGAASALRRRGSRRSRRPAGRAGLRPGPRPVRFGPSKVWLLPNPSGLNARYQLPELTRLFSRLRIAAGLAPRKG